MSNRVRALFFAALALFIGPVALPERSVPPELPADHALAHAPVEHQAHPAPYGARTWLADGPTERLTHAPAAPAPNGVELVRPLVAAAPAPLLSAVGASDAARRLPHSRGPPALS